MKNKKNKKNIFYKIISIVLIIVSIVFSGILFYMNLLPTKYFLILSLLIFVFDFLSVFLVNLKKLKKNIKKTISVVMIFIIIISNFITGLIFRNNKCTIINNTNYNSKNINISNIIKDTIDTLLMILGTLIFYNIIINLIPISNPIIKNIFNGTVEITTSLSSLKYIDISINIKILLSIIYLSFNGLSIHTQIKSILPDTNYNLFIKSRILCIFISILLCTFII